MQFPQRVPRKGLFDEINDLESSISFKRLVTSRIAPFIFRLEKLSETSKSVKLSEENTWEKINLCKLLLRYGEYDVVLGLSQSPAPSASLAIEQAVVRNQAKFYKSLSKGEKVNSKDFLVTAKKAMKFGNDLSPPFLINAIGRYVVAKFRYDPTASLTSVDRECANLLEQSLARSDESDLFSALRKAVGYRGLSMLPHYSFRQAKRFLDEMITLNVSMVASDKMNSTIIKENLYTSEQTLSKFHANANNHLLAEQHLRNMIQIDPLDSTGYSELALFMMNAGRIRESRRVFHTAEKLGPPGVGMNCFFVGIAELESNRKQRALECFRRVTRLDPYSISPWLEIVKLYTEKKNKTALRRTIGRILGTPALRKQLTHAETNELQSLSVH